MHPTLGSGQGCFKAHPTSPVQDLMSLATIPRRQQSASSTTAWFPVSSSCFELLPFVLRGGYEPFPFLPYGPFERLPSLHVVGGLFPGVAVFLRVQPQLDNPSAAPAGS